MKRWPLIRHVRWCWHRWQLNRWQAMWVDLGYLPNKRDEDQLQLIWEGKA